jgi:hypothetical protein
VEAVVAGVVQDRRHEVIEVGSVVRFGETLRGICRELTRDARARREHLALDVARVRVGIDHERETAPLVVGRRGVGPRHDCTSSVSASSILSER